MSGLLTDLYELTMAAGYFEAGKAAEKATFELSLRRLPRNRNFVIAAGLEQAAEYLLNLRFTSEELDYVRGLPQFSRVSPEFFHYLANFRFTGDLFAVPEGTPLFAGEPILNLRAPIIEAQIPETCLLSTFSFQTLIASKAARMTESARGRPVIEFGTRRAHTPEAGVLGARAAFIGGCLGTSNTLSGMRFGIPVYGTSAHSWVMSFPREIDAFRQLQKVMGPQSVQLIDTYDTLEGARRAAEVGQPLWGVRLDSGNLAALAPKVRAILDEAGLHEAKIMASGDLDEYRIRELVSSGIPIDSFGVGTELATSADAPAMGTVYKLVEMDIGGIHRFAAKFSEEKETLPGAKQIFRLRERDVIGRCGECCGSACALLRPVILKGRLVEPLPGVAASRERAARSIAELPDCLRSLDPAPPRQVDRSPELLALNERAQRNLGR